MGIWDSIVSLESSNIHSLEVKGTSCDFDETSEESIKIEKEYFNQYKNLAPEVENLVKSSDDYEKGSLKHCEDGAFTWVNKDGEYCVYSPRLRADLRNVQVTQTFSMRSIQQTNSKVSVVGPWYSSDKSFTDQYKREAEKMAEYLNGSYTVVSNADANIEAVADAILNNEIVIFDSHGIALNGTSYICLTSKQDITKDDYTNCHAVNGGNWYGVDGTAICNHLKGKNVKCKLLWMAMCEGMKKSGKGGMSNPLKDLGVSVIYGYSQSVSFYGDYLYEQSFFESIREGKTVSEAFEIMTDKFGKHDPAFTTTSSAYPVVVSKDDVFPLNPDSHQEVKSRLSFLNVPKTLKQNLEDGVICKNCYTTKAGKNVINLYINNGSIGKIYINKEFSDTSLDNYNGSVVFKDED